MPDDERPEPPSGQSPELVAPEVTVTRSPSDITVHRPGGRPVVAWRRRALAVRSALPQLAQNPVVLGASAAAVTIAARLAVEAAHRIATTPSTNRPVAITITAHVVHHVHVIHHVVDPGRGSGR